VFETEKEFSIGTKALFDFFSEIIVLELLKNRTINENEGIKLGYLFSEILTGNQSSENELSKIIQFMELDFPRSFYILTIKSRSEERNRYELTFLRKRMIQMLSHTVCIIFQNAIVFLTDQKNDCCWLRPESQFLNWLNDKRMVAGVSEIYHDAGAIKKAYHQTLKAIDLGLKTKETIYSYQQFRFSDLLQQIGNLNEWESLVHPALEKIKAYDAEKNSDLEETLYTYMKSGRSQAQTAKILHVHRSSLQYRLSKIESVMGISLDDYQTFLHLQLSIEVEKNSVLKTI
jgi:DNA-binding PucR family transcriptional regulator